MKDLFGQDVDEAETHRNYGHYDIPGTGPEGETCGTCRHLTRIRMANTYLKCLLAQSAWTHGPGTDIRAKDAACSAWMPKQEIVDPTAPGATERASEKET